MIPLPRGKSKRIRKLNETGHCHLHHSHAQPLATTVLKFQHKKTNKILPVLRNNSQFHRPTDKQSGKSNTSFFFNCPDLSFVNVFVTSLFFTDGS
jgi:hypothetical protein